MDYLKVSEAAEKWGLSSRRVRILCAENRIGGVIRKGNLHMIPTNAQKPKDGRTSASSKVSIGKLLRQIDEKQVNFRPSALSQGVRLSGFVTSFLLSIPIIPMPLRVIH